MSWIPMFAAHTRVDDLDMDVILDEVRRKADELRAAGREQEAAEAEAVLSELESLSGGHGSP